MRKTCIKNKRSRRAKTRRILQRGKGPRFSKMFSSKNNVNGNVSLTPTNAQRKAVSLDTSKRPTLRNRKEIIDPERLALLEDLHDVREEERLRQHPHTDKPKQSKKKVSFAPKTKNGGRRKKSRKSKRKSR